MKIVLFEDHQINRFYPLALTRPVWELRFGCFSVRERFEKWVNEKGDSNTQIIYLTRDYLAPYYKERLSEIKINDELFLSEDEVLFINARILPNEDILKIENNVILIENDIPVLFRLTKENLQKLNKDKLISSLLEIGLKQQENSFETFEYIWNLIELNSGYITKDFEYFFQKNHTDAKVIGDQALLSISEEAQVDPYVVFDVTHGPIIVEDGVQIKSFSMIEGPCYIGSQSRIMGAKVREGCSFGPHCRIGGEVEESIIQGYSNKYHEGFLGHAYLGEWVNLGALTTNSDLKNNYSTIKTYIPRKKVDTKTIKLGSFIGDFTKTSIGTLMITGSSVGVGSMLVHSGSLTPSHIPSFKYWIKNKLRDIPEVKDFLDTCETVAGRRDVKFSDSYRSMVQFVYENIEELTKKM